MNDERQSVDFVAVDQHVHLHDVRRAVFPKFVVHRGVASGDRLQLVEEIQHDLVHRQVVAEMYLTAVVGKIGLNPALAGAQGHHRPHILLWNENGDRHHRLPDLFDLGGVGHFRGVFHPQQGSIAHQYFINHGGSRGDEFHVEFSFEPLLDDVHVKQAQESAAKPKPQRLGHLGFKLERRIV